MKNKFNSILIVGLATLFATACTKDVSSPGTSVVTLSSQNVKMGEPLTVATNATSSNLYTSWSVKPSANTWISSPSSSKPTILFYSPGTYIITANNFADSSASEPYDSSSTTVVVSDSVYHNYAVCALIGQEPIASGDQITLMPISYSDSGLVVLAHTQDKYGNDYPSLGVVAASSTSGTYNFAFNNVTWSPCTGYTTLVPTPASGILSFSALGTGTYNVTISLNGVNYQGSLLVTDTDCTFIWNYTSGIIMSPLQIKKM